MTGEALRDLIRQLVTRVTVSTGNVAIVLNVSAVARRLGVPPIQISKELHTRWPGEDRIDTTGEP